MTSPSNEPASEIIIGPRNGADAPELNRDAEGLQIDLNNLYLQPTLDDDSHQKQWLPFGAAEDKHLVPDEAGLIPHEGSRKVQERRVCRLQRRTFIIVLSVATILVACAAIGGGLGGYYARRLSSPSPTHTTEPLDDPTPTEDANPVTSGTTGMASLPCAPAALPLNLPQATPRNLPNPYLTTGATFNITCRRGVPNNAIPKPKNFKIFIEYSFSACMNRCATEPLCRGVVYGANLTAMMNDGDPGANCLLKDSTWEPLKVLPAWFASGVKV